MKLPWVRDLKAVLYDFDGTLVHLTIDFQAMRRRTYELGARYGIVADERQRALPSLEFVAEAAKILAPEQFERFEAEVEALLREIEMEAAQQAALVPGVAELMASLHERGIKQGIVTRNCREATLPLVERERLPVGVVLTRDDVPRVKPDPDHLLRALDVLGVAGDRSLMVGDHPMDVQAGQAVGARTAAVICPGETPDRYIDFMPDLILNSVAELSAYFDER